MTHNSGINPLRRYNNTKYMKQKLMLPKKVTERYIIIVWDFHTPHLIINRAIRKIQHQGCKGE